jgi:hypothetical protein
LTTAEGYPPYDMAPAVVARVVNIDTTATWLTATDDATLTYSDVRDHHDVISDSVLPSRMRALRGAPTRFDPTTVTLVAPVAGAFSDHNSNGASYVIMSPVVADLQGVVAAVASDTPKNPIVGSAVNEVDDAHAEA